MYDDEPKVLLPRPIDAHLSHGTAKKYISATRAVLDWVKIGPTVSNLHLTSNLRVLIGKFALTHQTRMGTEVTAMQM